MVNRANGSLFRRNDGQYLMYLPKSLVEDTMFPIKLSSSVKVELSFKVGDDKIIIKKAEDENP